MGSAISTALESLSATARASDSIAVGFSGGKDSLAVLDMCTRTFSRVEAFCMVLVPGLECIESALYAAEARWKIPVRQVPHWVSYKLVRNSVMAFPNRSAQALPDVRLRDVYDYVKVELNSPFIASGAKRSDSAWRRWYLSNTAHYTDLLYPLLEWNKVEVLAYLAARKIPVPESSGRNATGVDLTTPSLLWLHERHPEDFRRLCEHFPFAEAVIWQARWYGGGAVKGPRVRKRGQATPTAASAGKPAS